MIIPMVTTLFFVTRRPFSFNVLTANWIQFGTKRNAGKTTHTDRRSGDLNSRSQYLYINLKTIVAAMHLKQLKPGPAVVLGRKGPFFIETQTTRIPHSKFFLLLLWLVLIEEVQGMQKMPFSE